MNSKKKFIEENLGLIKNMIAEKRPKFEIARTLGIKYETLNKYLIELGIKYSGNPSRKGIPHISDRKPIETYLVNHGPFISASRLRQKLIECGLKEERCEMCGNNEWMGKKIPLELHHINMDHFDNRFENLQVLCSNCHMVTHDYNNTKKKSSTKEKPAAKSEKVEKKESKKTVERKRKVERPDKETLYSMLCENSFTSVAKKYMVSDNAIRKWCDFYGIPRDSKYYKQYHSK